METSGTKQIEEKSKLKYSSTSDTTVFKCTLKTSIKRVLVNELVSDVIYMIAI